MLHILLLILKIILWIVLGLVALVLLLVTLVLLAPIHYRADVGISADSTVVTAKLRFLIVSVRVSFDKSVGQLENVIRIFGIPFGKNKDKKKKVKNKKTKKIKNDASEDKLLTDSNDCKQKNPEPEELKASEASGEAEASKQQEESGASEELKQQEESEKTNPFDDCTEIDEDEFEEIMPSGKKNKVKKDKSHKKKEKKEKASNNSKSGENKLDKINSKLETVKTKYNRFLKFWKMNCTVKTINYLKKYFPTLIRHILPRHMKGYVKYGFGDPAKTGQITGYLSLLPFMYQKNFHAEPDFYNKIILCDLNIKGWLQLGYIIRPVFKLHLWKTIKMARKI